MEPLIGQKLKHLRSELNLSLRALARKTGLSAVFLSQIERGVSNPSINSLQNIASSLNVPLNYFLSSDLSSSDYISQSHKLEFLLKEGKTDE